MGVSKCRKVGESMSLFGGKDTSHSKKQQRRTTLAELAGAGAGVGAGTVAAQLGHVKYQQNSHNQAMQDSKDINDTEQNWKTMLDIQNGKINMDDLDERKQRRFKRLIEDNAEDLNYYQEHPKEFNSLLKDLKQGQVVPLNPNQKQPSVLKQLVERLSPQKPVDLRGGNVEPLFTGQEEARMMFPNIIEHPAMYGIPAFFGLAGMAGAGMIARKHYDKVNEKNQEDDDLDKLQQMLSALKEKESQSNH